MEATPETAKQVLGIFDEQGFMKLLAVAGYLLPYALLFGVYKLGRYFVAECRDTLNAINEKLGGK